MALRRYPLKFGACAIAALWPCTALCVLDCTADGCEAFYGTRVHRAPFVEGQGTRDHHLWNGFFVGVFFTGHEAADRRCESLSYEKEVVKTGTGPHEITPEEIENILAINAGDSSWERFTRGWRRTDGRAFAWEFRYKRDGIPANTLAVFHGEAHPQLAARINTAADRDRSTADLD